jgi:ribosome-binding protein aMBF1 (putative translation factor)
METMIDKDDEAIRKHLKEFVPERMEELGISNASELSRRAKINTAMTSRIINGLNTPSMANALKLARALECDMNAIYGFGSLVHS